MASPLVRPVADLIPGSLDDVRSLVSILPHEYADSLASQPVEGLLEVVLDLGRAAEARFVDRVLPLGNRVVRREDIRHVVGRVGEFTEDNRAGIERTLHRISAVRSRRGEIIGLTMRVGRAIYGTIDILRDLIETGLNILLLGRPGIGKTTMLRETARVLSDDLRKRVIVIDTSNEIGGDGDIPHPAIGRARRMQVPHPGKQHAVMIEAVENHMPEVIIVDEIGTVSEAAAARTIAERGVQLVGTAHGTTLENLILNPTLSDLVGGVHTVTLGDEEARRRRTAKTINERRAPPTFDIIVELVGRDEVVVHRDTAVAVDLLLAGTDPQGQRRRRSARGTVEIEEQRPAEAQVAEALVRSDDMPARIFPYGIEREFLDRAIRNLGLTARSVVDARAADVVVALRSRSTDHWLRKLQDERNIPVHVLKKPSGSQLKHLLQSIFSEMEGNEEESVKDAVRETEFAIQRALNERVDVALSPRKPPLRKMQHRMVSRYHLRSESVGVEPVRHLVIYAQ